jgi:hypothetical protein
MGDTMDISGLAARNSDNLKRSYYLLKDKCKNQDELDVLSRFAGTIRDEWTISINMRPYVLTHFLITGTYLNVYQLKERDKEHLREHRSEISLEEAVKKHLGDYYKSRTTFNRLFENGEKFKYGALTVGGLGLRKFGEYCVVIKRKQSKNYVSLAFIKRDSLDYVDGDHVDIEQLSQDVADRETVHFLACLKHEDEIKKVPSDEWASLICCDECYVEAVAMDDILNSHVECIRMSKEEHDLHYVYLYIDYISELPDFEKYRLYEFKNMKELSRKLGIKIEVIEG